MVCSADEGRNSCPELHIFFLLASHGRLFHVNALAGYGCLLVSLLRPNPLCQYFEFGFWLGTGKALWGMNLISSEPQALRLVDKELERLQSEGTLEPVEISEWEAPIVVVLKRDRPTVRFCGDFSVTVNPVKVVCIICTITSSEICIIESQSWIDTQFRKSRICLHG